MGRRAANILLSKTDPKTRCAHEVCAAQDLYAVCLDGAPVRIRIKDRDRPWQVKYFQAAYVSREQAARLVLKMNQMFRCDRFSIRSFGGAAK